MGGVETRDVIAAFALAQTSQMTAVFRSDRIRKLSAAGVSPMENRPRLPLLNIHCRYVYIFLDSPDEFPTAGFRPAPCVYRSRRRRSCLLVAGGRGLFPRHVGPQHPDWHHDDSDVRVRRLWWRYGRYELYEHRRAD